MNMPVMKKLKDYRFRKCSDVNMEYCFFELVVGENDIILDINATDSGVMQVNFHSGSFHVTFGYDQLQDILKKGYELMAAEIRGE